MRRPSEPSRPQSTDAARPFKTVFEHLTALFFLAASEAAVDWAIVETGLGGRLDATNVLDPGPVLLTRIGLEHTHLLGDTIPLIAAEKAAILKPGGWAVASAQDPAGGAAEVFQSRAREISLELRAASSAISPNAECGMRNAEFQISNLKFQISNLNLTIAWAPDLCPIRSIEAHPAGLRLRFAFRGQPLDFDLSLYGEFQAENLQNALAMLTRLEQENLVPALPPAAIAAALTALRIPGRMEKVCDRPELFADGGHCPTAAAALARTMQGHFGDQPAGLLVGMMAEKDHDGFFRALGAWPHWSWLALYRADSPRAAAPEILAHSAIRFFRNIRVYENLDQALESIPAIAEKMTRVIATGSLYSIARLQDWGGCHGAGWISAEVPAET